MRGVHLLVLIMALAGWDGIIQNIPTFGSEPTTYVKGHDGVNSVAFAPFGSILATGGGGWDKGRSAFSSAVTLRDTVALKAIRSIPVPEQVQEIAFSPDGKTLAVAGHVSEGTGHAYLFDPTTGERLKSLDGSTGSIHGLAFSPEGNLLVTCGSTYDQTDMGYKDGKVAVWEVPGGRQRRSHEWPGGTYRSVSFDPSGRYYVTGGGVCGARPGFDSGEVHVWDAATGRTLWSRRGHSRVVECVAFSPDGVTVASGGMDGVLKLWDATDGSESFAEGLGGGRYGRVLKIVFSPDGKYVVAALGSHNRGNHWGELRAWEIRAKPIRAVSVFKGSSAITGVAFSPHTRLLAAGENEGTLRLWDPAKVLVAGPHD